MEILLSGLQLGESPRWHDNRLWFSDWMAHEVIAVDLDGQREVIARVEAFPFCLDWLPDGQLLIVAGSDGLILRQEGDGTLVPHADLRAIAVDLDGQREVIARVEAFPFCLDWLPDGQLLIVAGSDGLILRQEGDGTLVPHADLRAISNHPWNEIVVDGRGNIYVNTIGFDFPGGEFATGYIALVTPDGSVRQVADGVAFPNGMAVTPDNKTLILAESYGNCLTAFDIADDGTLANRRVWADCKDDHPDGICLDAEGAVWYADVGNQHCVRVREGGEVLQTIQADRGCFACMLGSDEGKTLFILANNWSGPDSLGNGGGTGQVLAVQVDVPGAGWP